jgi:hypothetical protein
MSELKGEDHEPSLKLRSLAQSTFPKLCDSCGLNYQTSEQFSRATHSPAADVTGLTGGGTAMTATRTFNCFGTAVVALR